MSYKLIPIEDCVDGATNILGLGVHALRWRWQEWGEPKWAIAEDEEIDALRAENEALIKLMEEAMTNCETCRGEPVVSRMCARCQTFYKAIIA